MIRKKILAFGASNSTHSINKRLATYAANQMEDVEVTVLDLNDFEMPIYSIDREKDAGIPELAVQFKDYIKSQKWSVIYFAPSACRYSAAKRQIPGGNIDTRGWMLEEYKELIYKLQGDDVQIVESLQEQGAIQLLNNALANSRATH